MQGKHTPPIKKEKSKNWNDNLGRVGELNGILATKTQKVNKLNNIIKNTQFLIQKLKYNYVEHGQIREISGKSTQATTRNYYANY